jgi:hypothetical protein
MRNPLGITLQGNGRGILTSMILQPILRILVIVVQTIRRKVYPAICLNHTPHVRYNAATSG